MYHIGKLRKSLTILLLLLIVKLYYLINMSPRYENSNNSQLFIQEKKLVENFLLFQKHSIIYSGKKNSKKLLSEKSEMHHQPWKTCFYKKLI